jgi:hypothetical protein
MSGKDRVGSAVYSKKSLIFGLRQWKVKFEGVNQADG